VNNAIVDYHQDEDNHWVARLSCGHFQHVRHNPPWSNREWVISVEGRQSMLGYKLNCKKCDEGVAKDFEPTLENNTAN